MADEKVNEMSLEEMEDDIVTLLDEDGKEVDFYHVATIECKKQWYIFLHPVEEMDDVAEDEVLIFRLGEDADGNDTILPVESEEELNEVYAAYVKEMESDECECDEGCDCGDDCHCGEDGECHCKE